VTPFLSDGEIDFEGLKQNVDFQIESGVDAILPLGTTGEAPTISKDEQSKILECVVEYANGRVPVVVGTGTNNTRETIELTKRAKSMGAQCALIAQPYYSKPSQEGIFRHFEAVAEACDLPILVYNIKGRTGVNIETSTMLRIATISTICGVKEASGDLAQINDVIVEIQNKRDGFAVLSGDDALTLPLMALGGKGVVSVVTNIVPRRMVALVSALRSENYPLARKLHEELLPIFKASFIESNPIPIKTMMRLCGMPAGPFRLPLCDASEKNIECIKPVLTGLGLSVVVSPELKVVKSCS
ncbi:MAG: 4-hydroxy-tetrahydrodipicolinate synthase, partial [Bdellovibrionales bacterium]|nr:4-hydroxy-tetrahydrodipicolinate synthase [Bdellovibrionales bacterium]